MAQQLARAVQSAAHTVHHLLPAHLHRWPTLPLPACCAHAPVAHHTSPACLFIADALNQLGGGIRGLFRIDRTYRPKSAITAAGPGAVGSRGGAAGWGASSGTASAGPSDSWTVVAASAPRPQQAPTALPPQQQQEEDAGPSGNASALPSGWTVIGSKKAPRVAKPAAAAGGGGGSSSRGAGIFRMGLADDAWEA